MYVTGFHFSNNWLTIITVGWPDSPALTFGSGPSSSGGSTSSSPPATPAGGGQYPSCTLPPVTHTCSVPMPCSVRSKPVSDT